MSKVSKVKVRFSERSWTPADGGKTSYFVKVEMENGDKGDIMRYNSGEVSVGEEIEYDYVESTKKPGEFSIRPVKKAGGFGGGFKCGSYQKEDVEFKLASFGWSYAKDMVVADKLETKLLPEMAEKIALGIQALTAKLKLTAPKPSGDTPKAE